MRGVLRVGALMTGVWLFGFTSCGGPSGDPVSAAEQKTLPTDPGGLVEDLCFRGDSAIDREAGRKTIRPRARRQFRALERSLRRHPEATVRVQIVLADSPEPKTEETTVRQLAERHRDAAQNGDPLPNEKRCHREEQARLERLLDETP